MNRDDLYRCRDIEVGIKSAMVIYEIKFARVTRITQHITDMPKAIGGIKDDLEELIDFYRDKIEQKQKEAKELNKAIEGQLELMKDERYSAILRYYYIGGLSVSDIANKMGYEEKYTSKLKSFAIEDFEKYDTKSHQITPKKV